MFAKLSVIPPFFDINDHNGVFDHILGNDFDGDYTMLATLRALLFPRLPRGEYFTFNYARWSSNDFTGYNAKDIFARIGVPENNLIRFIGLSGSDENIQEKVYRALDNAKNGAVKEYGFTELKDIESHFMAKYKFNMRFFIKPEINYCAVFFESGKLNCKYFHTFVAILPRYIPNFFKDETPLTPEETNVCRMLVEKDSTDQDYIKALDVLAERINIRKLIIDKVISGFQRRIKSQQLEAEKSRFNDILRQIESTLNSYEMLLENKNDCTIRIEGLRYMLDNCLNDDELVEYFNLHKNIDLLGTDGSRIDIIIKTTLNNYDPNGYETFARSGGIYNNYYVENDTFRQSENRKLLMDNLFNENPLLKIKMIGYYRLNINGRASSSRHYEYPAKYADYIPNPHLDMHNCLGNNEPIINKCLADGDTISAVECCTASCGSVNIHETSQTFRPFMELVFNNTHKIITNSEGVDMTPVEALEWLKNRVGENNETNIPNE